MINISTIMATVKDMQVKCNLPMNDKGYVSRKALLRFLEDIAYSLDMAQGEMDAKRNRVGKLKVLRELFDDATAVEEKPAKADPKE